MTTQQNPTKINLVESWLDFELSCPGFRKADALRDLNEALGKNYDMNRLNKWQRGDEAVPQPVQNHMLELSIQHILIKSGGSAWDFTDDQLNMIAKMLTPPERR